MDFAWPDNADVAVSLTFDVDAEAGWVGMGRPYAQRLTALSEGRGGAWFAPLAEVAAHVRPTLEAS